MPDANRNPLCRNPRPSNNIGTVDSLDLSSEMVPRLCSRHRSYRKRRNMPLPIPVAV